MQGMSAQLNWLQQLWEPVLPMSQVSTRLRTHNPALKQAEQADHRACRQQLPGGLELGPVHAVRPGLGRRQPQGLRALAAALPRDAAPHRRARQRCLAGCGAPAAGGRYGLHYVMQSLQLAAPQNNAQFAALQGTHTHTHTHTHTTSPCT